MKHRLINASFLASAVSGLLLLGGCGTTPSEDSPPREDAACDVLIDAAATKPTMNAEDDPKAFFMKVVKWSTDLMSRLEKVAPAEIIDDVRLLSNYYDSAPAASEPPGVEEAESRISKWAQAHCDADI